MIRRHGRTLVLAATALLCLGAGFLHADPPVPTMVLSLPDVVGTSGSVVQVPLSAGPADGAFGIDLTVTYNPAVLTAQDVTVTGIASTAGFVVIKNLNTPGTVVISMYGPQDPLAGSGPIANIQFLVAGASGSSTPLAFTYASANEGHIPTSTDDGSFTVVASGATLTLPDTAQGGPGATVQVPISITTASDVLGIDMTITYDSAVVSAQSVAISGIGTAAGFAIASNLNTPGVMYITAYATGDPLTGAGEFASITFQVTGSPGDTSALTFTAAQIDEGSIPATTDDGLFTVTCAGAADGTPCDDGESACTPVDSCQGGVCVGTPLSCDDGNPCTVDSCTPGTGCSNVPGNAGATCRAAAGDCDLAETCTGTSAVCPADAVRPSGDTCRPSAGACDVAESCDGSSVTCPADVFASVATSCTGTSSGGACDGADHCSGTDNTCVDVFQPGTFECRGSAGPCDVAETCTGSSGVCPADVFASAATSCTGTSSGGACDAADHCSGTANTCVDVFQPSTFTCRGSAGQCDVAETCTGSSGVCPADVFASAATSCTGTSSGGACDAADHCSGTANTCVDVFQPGTFECRGSAGQCDVAETCTGSTGVCPADVFASAATSCTGTSTGGACDAADHCSGSANTCVDVFQPSTFTCRGSAGQCDVAETCTGSTGVCPADVFASAATSCTGTSTGGACDAADHCSGTANTCVDVFQPGTFECRGAAGPCDVAETCTGASGTCPADVFASAATSCTGTSTGGACDAADHCSGTANTCVDVFQPGTFTCRGAAGPCDVAETCTGSSGVCPADVFASAATSCTGTSTGGACDGADHCSGTANTCVDVFQPGTFECRGSAGACDVAETCTGASGSCPADVFASAATSCTGISTGGACDAADHCSGTANTCVDVFQPGTFVCRGSASSCDVAESCTGSSGTCPADLFVPNGTSCDDANATTCTDVCTSGACAGTPVAEPAVIGDSVTLSSAIGGGTDIAWTDAPGPYNVYRGTKGAETPWQYDQACLVHETPSALVNDADTPPPGTLFYYLVSRVDACRESILGLDSGGVPIPNANPCTGPPASTNLLDETFDANPGYDLTWTENSSGGTALEDATTNPPVGSGGPHCSGFDAEALQLTAGAFDQPSTWTDIGAAQAGEVDFRGYLYVAAESIAPSGSTAIMIFSNAAAPTPSSVGTARIELQETAGDQLQLNFFVGFTSIGTFDVATGACYVVELKFDDATNQASVRINSADVVIAAAADPGAGSEFLGLGVENTASATVWWDTVSVGNTGYIGP